MQAYLTSRVQVLELASGMIRPRHTSSVALRMITLRVRTLLARRLERRIVQTVYTVLQNLPFYTEASNVSGSCFSKESFTRGTKPWPALSSPQAL